MSLTFPEAVNNLRKGGYVMLQDRPCRISAISVSKTGKHGHAKASITGYDIFNHNKHDGMFPTSHNAEVPVVNNVQYQVMGIDEDGFLSLFSLEGAGDLKEDLQLPTGEEALCEEIRNKFAQGKDVIVTVLNAMNEEKVIACR